MKSLLVSLIVVISSAPVFAGEPRFKSFGCYCETSSEWYGGENITVTLTLTLLDTKKGVTKKVKLAEYNALDAGYGSYLNPVGDCTSAKEALEAKGKCN